MEIQTSRFGVVDVEDDQVLNMPDGVIGFEEYTSYALLDHSPDSPFKWLQSVENPNLAFVVTDPLIFVPDYKANLNEADLAFLGAEGSSGILILVLVTIKRGSSVSANLLGPIAINLENHKAKQLIISDSAYSVSHNIVESNAVISPENN